MRRYEKQRPGELVHVDIKKLGRFARASDNGSGYRSFVFAQLCKLSLIRHSFTKAYRPQTNGKAERFIQTLLSRLHS